LIADQNPHINILRIKAQINREAISYRYFAMLMNKCANSKSKVIGE